jgi:enolase-phosphatase E1
MTSTSNTAPIRGILLDIEGTTTPISFVHEVLFAYARANLTNYLTAHFDSAETQADLESLRQEHADDVEAKLTPPPLADETRDAEIESVVAYVNWLIDRDRKSTALKALQGKIWELGYLAGRLKAKLFEDVAPALERWKSADLSINIFSSGSVLAQKLLFAHTDAGDLSSVIDNYFDTTTGPKTEVESYRRIARSLGLPAEQVIFISDVVAELDAASAAGMQTLLCLRPGNAPQPGADKYERVHSFEGLTM